MGLLPLHANAGIANDRKSVRATGVGHPERREQATAAWRGMNERLALTKAPTTAEMVWTCRRVDVCACLVRQVVWAYTYQVTWPWPATVAAKTAMTVARNMAGWCKVKCTVPA